MEVLITIKAQRNQYIVSKDGKFIIGHTAKQQTFLFDAKDYETVKQYTWHISKRGYVTAKVKRKSVPMHKILIWDTPGFDIDHISRNRLDNRRSNLRICTHQENMFNQKKRKNNKTGYMGVSLMRGINRYEAYIHYSGKKYHLGLFDRAEEAAAARDKKAIYLFGKFVHLNFPARNLVESG